MKNYKLIYYIIVLFSVGVIKGLAQIPTPTTIIPFQGYIKHHKMYYFLHYPAHQIYFGDTRQTWTVIKQKNGTTYFINEYGPLLSVSPDGYELIFEKGGKKFKLKKQLYQIARKYRKQLIDVLPNWVIYKEDNQVKIADGKNTRSVSLPSNALITSIWMGNDSLKILFLKETAFSNIRQGEVVIFAFKPSFHEVDKKKAAFLSARDGNSSQVLQETVPSGGIVPISSSKVYINLSKGGYLNYILPLKAHWLASEVYPDSVVTYKVTFQNNTPVWRRNKTSLLFVGFYDSTLVYQVGNTMGWGTPGGVLYQYDLPDGSRLTYYQKIIGNLIAAIQNLPLRNK